jgi:hypothetical protein
MHLSQVVSTIASLLIGSLQSVVDKLQRVLNAAARLISYTKKYDRGLTGLLHDQLHWLDMSDRIKFRVAVFVFNSLHDTAPRYLSEMCSFNTGSGYNLRRDRSDVLVVPQDIR